MSLNLACILESSARRFPGEPAILFDGQRMTYRELREQAHRAANALTALGVRPGDRVALMVPNRPEFTVAYFGILLAGAIVVPLNTLLVAEEIAYHLEDSGAVVFLAWREYEEAA